MPLRVSEVTISTPCISKNVVRWSLEYVEEGGQRSYYALITARTFTAMMIEGVINHIGEVIIIDWNEQPVVRASALSEFTARLFKRLLPKYQIKLKQNFSKERMTIKEKHKAVRKAIGLNNGGSDYSEFAKLISEVFSFRDSHVHPKLINDEVHEEVKSEVEFGIPDIGWQTQLNAKKIRSDYDAALAYCENLCDKGAQFILSMPENNFIETYGNCDDSRQVANELKTFLFSEGHAIGTTSYNEENGT